MELTADYPKAHLLGALWGLCTKPTLELFGFLRESGSPSFPLAHSAERDAVKRAAAHRLRLLSRGLRP